MLFDVGGVLVELSGIPKMLAWLGHSVSREELWRMWLTSPAVRAFETGRMSPDVFAGELIAEMSLPVEREELLHEFTHWPRCPFPGALALVRRIPPRYTRATLSNTNALHWPRITVEMQLGGAFDHHFASHLIGKIKPDAEVFRHVSDELRCAAEEILFLDDNLPNVEAARLAGMIALQADGVEGAERALLAAGVLDGVR